MANLERTMRRLPTRFAIIGQVVCVMAAIAVLSFAFANSYWLSTLGSAFALAIACRGVTLLYGQLGLVSLCQFALVGVGGWVGLRLSHGLHLPFEAVILIAGIITAAFGIAAGAPALRFKGLYLALVTLMLAGAFQTVISAIGFPDGGTGLLGRAEATQRVMMSRPVHASGDAAYVAYVAIWAALMLAMVEWLRTGRPGRAWALIRKGDQAAMSTGIDLLRFKLLAFAVAGFLAGVSGTLLAGNVGQLDGRAFAASESLYVFSLSVVGGAYHWFGALIAGLLLRAIPSLLTDLGTDGYVSTIVFGGALMHALITAPRGIAGQISNVGARLSSLVARSRERPHA